MVWNSDGPNSSFKYLQMRILHSNIRECEYYFNFYVYYFMTCNINWKRFYRLVIYYIYKKKYCKSSAIKSLMKFWNLTLVAKTTFGNYCKLASSQSSRHKSDYYRITDAHNAHSIFLFSVQNLQILLCFTESYYAVNLSYSTMEYGVYNFMDSWSEKKTTECLFLIFANANAIFFFIRTCEYSHFFSISLVDITVSKITPWKPVIISFASSVHTVCAFHSYCGREIYRPLASLEHPVCTYP